MICIAALAVCAVASAQTKAPESSGKGDYQRPRDKYVIFNAGAQFYSGMSDHHLSYAERLAPVGGVTFGRFMNNWLMLDGTITIAQFKGLYVREAEGKHFATNRVYDLNSKTYYQNGAYTQAYVRAGLDLNSLIAGYKPSRRGSFVPYAGAGFAAGLDWCFSGSNLAVSPTLDYGLQYICKLDKDWSILLDFHGNGVGKAIEGEPCDKHSMHVSYGLKFGVLKDIKPNKREKK